MSAEAISERTRKDRIGYLFLRGKTYWIQYQIGGRRFSESLRTRNEREANERRKAKMAPFMVANEADALRAVKSRLAAAEEQAAALNEASVPPLKLEDAWSVYLENEIRPQSGPETLKQYASHWRQFTRWLANRSQPPLHLRDITADIAGEYARHLGKRGLSGNRYNKYIVFLRCFFRSLKPVARLSINPFDAIARRKHIPQSKRPLTIDELKRILETAEGELRVLLFIGTFTGLRLGDAATLRWCEVDLHRRLIRRIPNKTARTGRHVLLGIPDVLAEHLERIPSSARKEFVLPGVAKQYMQANTRPALSIRIQSHFKSCGIRTVKSGTGPGDAVRAVVEVGFHSLRHSYITFHAQGGTPQPVLMKMAGHGNPVMTEHYVHLSEDVARKAVAALPEIVPSSGMRHAPAAALVSQSRAEIVRLIRQMTPKTWRRNQEELLRLITHDPSVIREF